MMQRGRASRCAVGLRVPRPRRPPKSWWQAFWAPGRVFGLATSQVATDVLAGEGLTARNVTRWVATQDRLAAAPVRGQAQPDDVGWAL